MHTYAIETLKYTEDKKLVCVARDYRRGWHQAFHHARELDRAYRTRADKRDLTVRIMRPDGARALWLASAQKDGTTWRHFVPWHRVTRAEVIETWRGAGIKSAAKMRDVLAMHDNAAQSRPLPE